MVEGKPAGMEPHSTRSSHQTAPFFIICGGDGDVRARGLTLRFAVSVSRRVCACLVCMWHKGLNEDEKLKQKNGPTCRVGALKRMSLSPLQTCLFLFCLSSFCFSFSCCCCHCHCCCCCSSGKQISNLLQRRDRSRRAIDSGRAAGPTVFVTNCQIDQIHRHP